MGGREGEARDSCMIFRHAIVAATFDVFGDIDKGVVTRQSKTFEQILALLDLSPLHFEQVCDNNSGIALPVGGSIVERSFGHLKHSLRHPDT